MHGGEEVRKSIHFSSDEGRRRLVKILAKIEAINSDAIVVAKIKTYNNKVAGIVLRIVPSGTKDG